MHFLLIVYCDLFLLVALVVEVGLLILLIVLEVWFVYSIWCCLLLSVV